MKLIIDIPEDVYKRMMNSDLPIYMAYKYVKNGTPLDALRQEPITVETIDQYCKEHNYILCEKGVCDVRN